MDAKNTNGFQPFSLARVQISEKVFFHRVYQWMAIGLIVTGFVASQVAMNVPFMQALARGWFYAFVAAEIAIVIWLSYALLKVPTAVAGLGFLVYSILNGVTLSFVFLVYTGASITTTFFITAGTFVVVSLFGGLTQIDLSSFRGFFLMSLIGIILGSVANLFLKSPFIYWVLTYFGLAVFIGLTAYDTQRLKEIYREGGGHVEQLAIRGALNLYLDFINLFIHLLRLFGRRR